MSDDLSSVWNDDKETPTPQVALKGVEDGESGLRAHGEGTGFMLRIKPQNGYSKFIPYSRIEELDLNEANTHLLIYAARCIVSVQGEGLDALGEHIQKAKVWSLSVGKAERNDVNNTRIDITNPSDSASLAQD